MGSRRFGCGRVLVVIAGITGALLIVVASAGWIVNRSLPTRSALVDRLAEPEKMQVVEATRIRQIVGSSIWPAWERADIPVILYNETYAFLIGYEDPPPGWLTVPKFSRLGTTWEVVPGDKIDGHPYYRQRLRHGVTPQSFTVRVGDRWAASLQTKEWFGISLGGRIRRGVPPPFAPFLPYRWITRIFMGGTDGYIALVLHESFHAFQGTVAPERVAAAERVTNLDAEYEKSVAPTLAAWREELALLRTCAVAQSRAQALPAAREFLAHRAARRAAQKLDGRLIDYERQREWLEGLAKYAELESWRRAGESAGYRPRLDATRDPDFSAFQGFPAKWARELAEMKRAAGNDVRFYYSGMAQAIVLDRLAPGWKANALTGGAALDELIAEAVRVP